MAERPILENTGFGHNSAADRLIFAKKIFTKIQNQRLMTVEYENFEAENSKMADDRHLDNRYIAIFQQIKSDFD